MSRKFKTDNYDHPLNNVIGHWDHNVAEGAEYGIEIEVEGTRLPRDRITGWIIHEDGSLRGESAEYVFRTGEPYDRVAVRLAALQKAFNDANSVINDSYRTSVHVHRNVRDWQVKKIYNLIMLYIIFEEALGEFCGKDRVGNLFCLRARDAGFFMEQLRNSIITDQLHPLAQENLRYSAVNPQSMWRHGTIEFRGMRGTTDINLIQTWVDIIAALSAAAQNYENPITIVQDFSNKGPEQFAFDIFGEKLMPYLGQNYVDSVYPGIQLVQHAAYGHDWTPIKKDGSVESKRKASAQLNTYTEMLRMVNRPNRFVMPQPVPVEQVGIAGGDWAPDPDRHAWVDNFNEREA